MSGKIFISYSRADSEFAHRLAHDLRTANLDVWLDKLDIPPGATWDRAVEEALRECNRMIVVLSPSAVASRHVMDEVSFALDENKTLLPVLHRACDIPFRLRRIQFTDFTSGYFQGLSDLVRVFGLTVRPKARAQPRPAPQPARPNLEASSSAQEPSSSAQAPVATAPRRRFWTRAWIPRYPRVDTALKTGLAGAFAGFCVLLIYQLPSLPFESPDVPALLLVSGKVFGVPWFIAGAIAGPRRGPLMCAYVTGLFAFMAWLVFYDGFIALLFGWAGGGVVGALIGVAALRSRANAGVRESWRERPG